MGQERTRKLGAARARNKGGGPSCRGRGSPCQHPLLAEESKGLLAAGQPERREQLFPLQVDGDGDRRAVYHVPWRCGGGEACTPLEAKARTRLAPETHQSFKHTACTHAPHSADACFTKGMLLMQHHNRRVHSATKGDTDHEEHANWSTDRCSASFI